MRVFCGIFVYSWIASILYGVLISMISTQFKEYCTDNSENNYPLYNLFGLCSYNGYDERYALLFLVPFVNLVFMVLMLFKLKKNLRLNSYDLEEEKEENEEDKLTEPEEEPWESDVDSIFKSNADVNKNTDKPYKAKRVHVNENFINSAPAEREHIEKVKKGK